MPPKTETRSKQRSFRLTPEAERDIAYLADRWQTITRPSAADVVIECLRRVREAESRPKKKS